MTQSFWFVKPNTGAELDRYLLYKNGNGGTVITR